MMAMLALPYAQAARPQAPHAETRLSAILQGLADPTTDQNERELLKGLTYLSAQSEQIAGDITYRFSAGRALCANGSSKGSVTSRRLDFRRPAARRFPADAF